MNREYLDRMPQMFQMMHLRSWAGEAATSKPAWASFIWLSQQYFSGLIAFAFFLLTQCKLNCSYVCCRYVWANFRVQLTFVD